MQRRDFLNGMALAVVAGMTPLQLLYGKDSKIEALQKNTILPIYLD